MGPCTNLHPGMIDSSEPYSADVWAKIPRGNETDAKLAVDVARNAMTVGPWAKISATERGKILRRIGDAVSEQIEGQHLQNLQLHNARGRPQAFRRRQGMRHRSHQRISGNEKRHDLHRCKAARKRLCPSMKASD